MISSLLCFLILLKEVLSYSGSDSSKYPTDSLRNLGSLFPLAGDPPSHRVYHTISCCIGENAVIYGGYGSDGGILDDIHVYDSRFQKWSGPILAPQCCNEIGEVVETLGAKSPGSIRDYYGKIGFQGDLPLGRAEHGAVILNDILYIFGGQTTLYNQVNDLYKFDMVSIRWTKLGSSNSQAPVARAGHAMTAISATRFLVFGGRAAVPGSAVGRASNPRYTVSNIFTKLFGVENNYTSFNGASIKGLNDVWEYNTVSRSWYRLTPTNSAKFTGYNAYDNDYSESFSANPAGREHASISVVNEKLYLFGGQDPVSGYVFSDVWVFDLSLGVWQQLIPNMVHTNTASVSSDWLRPTAVVMVPPLHSAHLLVASPVYEPSLSDSIAPTADSQNNTITTPRVLNFMLYGGLGYGGSCSIAEGDPKCNPLLTTLGQVYKLQVYVGTLISPKSRIDSQGDLRIQHEVVVNASWSYARLTSSQSSRGRLWKNHALESVAYCLAKHQLFELGGIVSTAPMNPPLDDMNVLEPFRINVGGGLERPLWNTITGEALSDNTNTPINNKPWTFKDAFVPIQSSLGSDSANFVSNFRVYIVGAEDIVLTTPEVSVV